MFQFLKKSFYIFLLLVAYSISLAQQPYAISYNKSNGLPSNTVYDVFQDSKGFIWISSNNGITRYDGIEYKTYTSKLQTSTAGSSIVEDAFGRIWYENFDGYIYYIDGDTLNSLLQNKPIQYLPISLTNKYLFVFQINGIDVYDLKTLKLITTKRISLDKLEFSGNSTSCFYFLIDDVLYKMNENLVISSSLFFKNKHTDIKQLYYHNHKIYIVNKYNASKLMYVFDEKLTHLYNVTIKEPQFIQGMSFSDSLIWIHTQQGTHAYFNNTSPSLYRTFFEEKNISSVRKDRQHNYWFSTTNDGVFLIPNLNTIVYKQPNFLPNKIVVTNQGYVIASKKGELYLYDSLFHFKSVLNDRPDNAEIYYLSYDTTNNNLFYSSKGFNHISQFNFGQNHFYKPAVKEIVKIDDSYYAFVASGYCGLAAFNPKKTAPSVWSNNYLTHLKTEVPNTSSILEGVRGKSVAYSPLKNTIYFATNIGLFKTTPTLTEEIKMNNESFYASKLICYNDAIYALSTKGNLYRIENEKQFFLLNKKYNMSEFDIKFIHKVGHQLVIITNNFAYILNLETESVKKIDIKINTYEINDVLLKGNNLFFLTNSGIIKTNINNNSDKKNNEALFELIEFSANSKPLDFNGHIELPYSQNDVAIKFSILDFGNTVTDSVFYKLNTSAWKRISKETRLIEFASLKPGKYTVSFKLNDVVTKTAIQFTIIAPFWKSIWFTTTCFLIALFVGYIYYVWQLNKLKNKNKLLEDKNTLLQEKMTLQSHLNKSVLKSIKAQMNPHFFYNALNTIQAYIFTNDKIKANNYLAKFSKLTRVILEQSEKETISLGDEIDALQLYLDLEKMRFKDDFEYTIKQKIITNKDAIEFPPMIIQPYVENAIKHGLLHKEKNKKLSIVFEENSQLLIVTIDDNGIGRKRSGELNKIKNDKHESFSTKANQTRLEILNEGNSNKVSVEIIDKVNSNHFPEGTTVILKIPII